MDATSGNRNPSEPLTTVGELRDELQQYNDKMPLAQAIQTYVKRSDDLASTSVAVVPATDTLYPEAEARDAEDRGELYLHEVGHVNEQGFRLWRMLMPKDLERLGYDLEDPEDRRYLFESDDLEDVTFKNGSEVCDQDLEQYREALDRAE
ncbi:hypothetical protein [Salinisphaera japonica]|uniref:Uncharacterized protein n=1 Tax=Salinisphaera japonica YTM-1 TaxID=1209778 RepID=A0A423PJ85_9GAMM|nr:hypothetical protein [Salinisphaera japonica]ROO25651.1 hypothetical protein SAJA_12530 [Salinisphaera japonica YTM-1]